MGTDHDLPRGQELLAVAVAVAMATLGAEAEKQRKMPERTWLARSLRVGLVAGAAAAPEVPSSIWVILTGPSFAVLAGAAQPRLPLPPVPSPGHGRRRRRSRLRRRRKKGEAQSVERDNFSTTKTI